MEKPLSLTILYTANIQGDIHMLPRLYTFLQTLKPVQRQGTLIFDLGNSCNDEVWHCRVTQGRSTLIVLDAMGYHAANIDKLLDRATREKIAGTITMGLVDASHSWFYHIPPIIDETIQAVFNQVNGLHRLQICLSSAKSTYIEEHILYLEDIPVRHIGVVTVDLTNSPILTNQSVHTLPENTPPNPTIVASVEFVESEAHYFQKKQSIDN